MPGKFYNSENKDKEIGMSHSWNLTCTYLIFLFLYKQCKNKGY